MLSVANLLVFDDSTPRVFSTNSGPVEPIKLLGDMLGPTNLK